MDRRAEIKAFLSEQFSLGIPPEDLADDHDLLSHGVIDSLALLTLASWLETRYGLRIETVSPKDFRTVEAIDAFVEAAQSTPAAGTA